MSDLDEVPLKVCHLGQAAGAGLSAFVLGALAIAISALFSPTPQALLSALLLCTGPQSVIQLTAQVIGASFGSYAMSAIDYRPFIGEMVTEAEHELPSNRPRPELGGPTKRFAVRAGASSVGALAVWLAFPPGLDFSLLASSLLIAVGAVLGTLTNEDWSKQTPAATSEGAIQQPSVKPMAFGAPSMTAAATTSIQPQGKVSGRRAEELESIL
mmetsp:Transcript_38681/g.58363  ORF Transcript_38681/g.58363 Transcript_38681/m.58363 type:complete len:213 (-) Transcript_38681:19-657(-)